MQAKACPGTAGDRPEPSVAWSEGDLGCEAYTGSSQAARSSFEIISYLQRPTLSFERKAKPERCKG